jgi:hypothetical protein
VRVALPKGLAMTDERARRAVEVATERILKRQAELSKGPSPVLISQREYREIYQAAILTALREERQAAVEACATKLNQLAIADREMANESTQDSQIYELHYGAELLDQAAHALRALKESPQK